MALLLLHCFDAPTEIGEPVQDAATGALLCPAFAATETIALYEGADGKPIREYVSPQSLRDMARLSARKPMTSNHPPPGVWVDASNYQSLQVGETGDDDGFLSVPEDAWGGAVRAKVAIKPTARRQDVIADIQARRKGSISAGYTKQVDNTPGVHPHLGAYDRTRTRVIDVNHFAFCETPRLEGSVLLGFDSAPPPLRSSPMNRAERRAFLRSADAVALAKTLLGKAMVGDAVDLNKLSVAVEEGLKDPKGSALIKALLEMAGNGEVAAPMEEPAAADPMAPPSMDAILKAAKDAAEAAAAPLRERLAVLDAQAAAATEARKTADAQAQAARDADALAVARTHAERHGLLTAATADTATCLAHLRSKLGLAADASTDAVIAVAAFAASQTPPPLRIGDSTSYGALNASDLA